MLKLKTTLSLCFAALLVGACGGGGGGGGSSSGADPVDPAPPAPAPPPPVTPDPTYNVSGVIRASDSQAVDSDTNDPVRVAVSNDLPSVAQAIGNPVTLGGYVNQPGTGAEGRSQIQGDTEDFFRVDLLAGQTVTMLVADFEDADADLYLYNARGELVDFSLDTGQIERIVIEQDGPYFVNASAFAGATNYIIAIGSPANPNQLVAPRDAIVPWQAVVKYRTGDDGDSTDDGESTTRRLGMVQRAGGAGRARLMGMYTARAEAVERFRRMRTVRHKLDEFADDELSARWETLLAIKSLRKDPAIDWAEPNYRVSALATPDDEAFPFQWHFPLIGIPEAWEITTGDNDVIVAVIDTGILANHPDLQGQLVAGYDFVRDVDNARDGNGIDPDPDDPGSGISSGVLGFHGTHVAGTIGAGGNNGIGVAGVAYGARIMPLRALGTDGGGTTYDVDQAIRFAAGLENDSGTVPARPADVINLSLGGGPFQQSSQNLLNQVRAAGVTVVAAAGNEATSRPSYPASYENVISVSAVDVQRRLTSYSNTGAFVDVAAPGGDNSVDFNGDGYPDGVLSLGASRGDTGALNYTYPFANGTSMASPHVAGVIALMLSVNPGLSPADIDALLLTGDLTDDLGASGRDDLYGQGLINANKAVIAALEASGISPADNPRLVASTASLNFSTNIDSLSLALSNAGNGALVLENLSSSESWVEISPVSVNASGLGEYAVTVDRSGLSAGVYSARITAQSSVNNLSVTALMSVGGAGTGADVGLIYILLYDAEIDQPILQLVTD
ncbi:MAG: S8 family serine peptidase, partial [Halioglobus sp.]